MGQTDYDLLVEMGFDPNVANVACKETKSLQDAIDWLDKNKDLDLSQTDIALGIDDSNESANDTREEFRNPVAASSLKCLECGKLFSSPERAEFHAARTEHANFEESTETVKPLTEEEKKARLEAAMEKLKKVRAEKEKNVFDQQREEAIRRKQLQERTAQKDHLQQKQQAESIRKINEERIQDRIRLQKVRDDIKKTEEARARAKKGQSEQRNNTPEITLSKPMEKNLSLKTEARLRVVLPSPSEPILKTFQAETTLLDVANHIESVAGKFPNSFSTAFPRKTFLKDKDFSLTLSQAGMVPSCSLRASW